MSTGFLATGSDFVDFIKWDENADNLSGTAQAVTTQGSLPDLTTTSDTFEVSGTIDGSAVSVSFDGGPQVFGTISGGSFALDFPQPDGTLASVTFKAASASQYNDAVSSLAQQLGQANQTAANEQALQQERQKIASDAATVSSDIGSLSQLEAGLDKDVQAIPPELQGEANDLTATQTAEEQVVSEAQQGPSGPGSGTCGDAEGVAGDAQGVAGDAQGVGGDAQPVEQDAAGSADSIRSELTALTSDVAQLQSDEAGLPGFSPSGAPGQSYVSQAASTANAAASSSISATNGYIDQANGDVTTAFQFVAQAFQAGNCGVAPGAPAAQQHIG